MLAHYKSSIIQIASYIPVIRKDFYYNPNKDHKEAVLGKMQRTNSFLKDWKNTLLTDKENKLKTVKADIQFIQKFSRIVSKTNLKTEVDNLTISEANTFVELLNDLSKILGKK